MSKVSRLISSVLISILSSVWYPGNYDGAGMIMGLNDKQFFYVVVLCTIQFINSHDMNRIVHKQF